MYCGHLVCVCLSVCVSVRGRMPTLLHGPGCNLLSGRGYPLVVHYWADLQLGHGLHCYGNLTRNVSKYNTRCMPSWFLWPPCVADADIIFLSCSFFFLSSIFFSSPNVSRHRLHVYHTSKHVLASVRISDAGLKRAACGSLKIHDTKKLQKNRHLHTIAQLCRAISSELRHVSTIGKKTC